MHLLEHMCTTSTYTMLHVRSILRMLFVSFKHTAHTSNLHVHASHLHTLVICCLLHNKKQKELLGASISQAFHMHIVKCCYMQQVLVTIEVALVALKRKLSWLKKMSTTISYQAVWLWRLKASHLCCTCMTCNAHTPSHPSTADEAWYWPKCVLCIGWLFNINA